MLFPMALKILCEWQWLLRMDSEACSDCLTVAFYKSHT